MGKALIFEGITISNPLEVVTFSDGLSAPVRNYLGQLSSSVSDAKKQAFQSFYEALVEAGIWDKITLLYPMYGNAQDCAYGLKGDNLTIPTGATYSNGIDLTNASGGYGNAGKGIKLLDTFPTTTTTNYSMFVGYPQGWTTAQRGYALVYASDSTRQSALSAGRYMGCHYADSSWRNFHATLAEMHVAIADGQKGFFGETHDMANQSHAIYINGTAATTQSGYSSTTERGGLGINASAQSGQTNHLLNVPINMVVVCNGSCLSSTEVAALSDAVSILSNVIFT